jgi:hypothetical protein
MRSIRVDDEVYAQLEKQAVGFDDPNGVLRRVLGLDSEREAQDGDSQDGRLLPQLKAGDELIWHRPRKNETHHATVTERGCIRLADDSVYPTPSAAALALAGNSANGWDVWEANGVKLGDLK